MSVIPVRARQSTARPQRCQSFVPALDLLMLVGRSADSPADVKRMVERHHDNGVRPPFASGMQWIPVRLLDIHGGVCTWKAVQNNLP